MTCSNITTYSLPAEIDVDGTFNVIIGLAEAPCPPENPHPDPDYIFAGIADSSDDYKMYKGWRTTALVDPGSGWTLTINEFESLKTFYTELTGLDEIPDVLHWKIATGPVDLDEGTFSPTASTPIQDINVIKPLALPLAWIALGATALGVAAVGIVSYKKWG